MQDVQTPVFSSPIPRCAGKIRTPRSTPVPPIHEAADHGRDGTSTCAGAIIHGGRLSDADLRYGCLLNATAPDSSQPEDMPVPTKPRGAAKSRKLAVTKETLKDLTASKAKAKAIRGGGYAIEFQTQICGTRPLNTSVIKGTSDGGQSI